MDINKAFDFCGKVAITPIARYPNPEDLVAPAFLLLSDSASFVHGTTLIVDEGMSAYGGI